MNRRLLKKREPSTALVDQRPLKKQRKTSQKKNKKYEIQGFEDYSGNISSSDDGATYLSDTLVSGAFTPFSTFSFSSKATGFTQSSRRKLKEQRKGLKRYNLRPHVRKTQKTSNGIPLNQLRSLTKQKIPSNKDFLNEAFEFSMPYPTKKGEQSVYQLETISEDDFESTHYCSQNLIEDLHFSNLEETYPSKLRSRASSKTKTRGGGQKQQIKIQSKPLETPRARGRKIKLPPMRKIFYEDKVSGIKQGFTLINEKDLPFLNHKILQPIQKKQLGNEDDNASDENCVYSAKSMLKKSLKEAIKERLNQDNASSRSSDSSSEEKDSSMEVDSQE